MRPCISLLLGLVILSCPASAAEFVHVPTYGFNWEGMFQGSRLAALGGADIAGDPGPGVLLFNAAPLPQGDGIAGGYARADYLDDLYFEHWGFGAEGHGLRLDFGSQALRADDFIVRTAYLPEGSETMDLKDRMTMWGVSGDLGRLLSGSGRFAWTLGVAGRRFSTDFRGDDTTTLDVGTSFRLRGKHRYGRWDLAGAATRQNLGGAAMAVDSLEVALPQQLRVGGTLTVAFDSPALHREALRIAVACAFYESLCGLRGDSQHYGLETTFLGLLSCRLGRDTRLQDGDASWGLGLQAVRPFGWPVHLAADYGKVALDGLAFSSVFTMEMWSLRGGVEF